VTGRAGLLRDVSAAILLTDWITGDLAVLAGDQDTAQILELTLTQFSYQWLTAVFGDHATTRQRLQKQGRGTDSTVLPTGCR
jgi:hypothetical protein